MAKQLVKSGLIGATAGIALSYIAAIVMSLWLQLGYFQAFPTTLPERVGGEMNAVLLQTAVCMLLGAGIGVAWRLMRRKGWLLRKRTLWASAGLVISILAALGLAVGMLK